jgi:hypothetical protein
MQTLLDLEKALWLRFPKRGVLTVFEHDRFCLSIRKILVIFNFLFNSAQVLILPRYHTFFLPESHKVVIAPRQNDRFLILNTLRKTLRLKFFFLKSLTQRSHIVLFSHHQVTWFLILNRSSMFIFSLHLPLVHVLFYKHIVRLRNWALLHLVRLKFSQAILKTILVSFYFWEIGAFPRPLSYFTIGVIRVDFGCWKMSMTLHEQVFDIQRLYHLFVLFHFSDDAVVYTFVVLRHLVLPD